MYPIRKNLSTLFLFIGLSTFGNQGWAQALTCQTLPLLFQTLLSQHVMVKNLTPDLRKKSVDQFVKQIDSSKSVLLESDINQIRSLTDGIFFSMKNGNCDGLTTVNKLYQKRVQEMEAAAKEILGPKFTKIDDSVVLVLDPGKRKFPANEIERKELLRGSINFQVWNLLDSGLKLDEAKAKIVHRYELLRKRALERDQQKVLVSMIDAFSSALDPHTSYLEPERHQDFNIDMSLSLEGIGASLSSDDGFTIVEEIIPGGAADRAGVLRQKDKIVAVGQGNSGDFQPVLDMELKDVVRLIRGKKGSIVRLSILRKNDDNSTRKVEVSLTRDKVQLKDQAAKIKYETRDLNGSKYKFAIIDLPGFYGDPEKAKRTAYDDVKDLIEEAKKAKVDGLVLNLERNGGGLLQDAVRISGLFIEEGAIVATQNSNGKMDILRDRDSKVQWSGPLVVLTSRISASASEILAGALKDYKRAVIVGGDHTFGKGTVQAVLGLTEELGAIKITTGMFFVPGGYSTQYRGVEADIVLPSTLSNDEIGERKLDNALEPKKIASFLSPSARSAAPTSWKVIDQSTLKELASLSKSRIQANNDFKKIMKDIDEAKKNQGPVKLADLIKKSADPEAKKKSKKDEKKSRQQLLDEYQRPYLTEAVNILADLTIRQRGLNNPPKMIIGGKSPEIDSTPKTVQD